MCRRRHGIPKGGYVEAVVLAGGLGTRLRSRVEQGPKAMAGISGRPFLEIILEQLEVAGFDHVVLAVGYERGVIIRHFGETFGGISLSYSEEVTPLGTGGAIKKALNLCKNINAFVLNGDTYAAINFQEMMSVHANNGNSLTLSVTAVPDVTRYGGVHVQDGRAIRFREKGTADAVEGWINAGIYCMNTQFPWGPNDHEVFSFEQDFLSEYVERYHPHVCILQGKFIDIGTPEDFDRAQSELNGR